jgi:hypothetical protein
LWGLKGQTEPDPQLVRGVGRRDISARAPPASALPPVPDLLSPTGAGRFRRRGSTHGLPATAGGRPTHCDSRFSPAAASRVDGGAVATPEATSLVPPRPRWRQHRRCRRGFETEEDGRSRRWAGAGGRGRIGRTGYRRAIHSAGPPGWEDAPDTQTMPEETSSKASGGEEGTGEKGLACGNQCGSRSSARGRR